MADGGLAEVYAVCPDVGDAGEAYELDGGTWVLPAPRGPHLACKLAGCEEYVARSESPLPPFSAPSLILMFAALALGLLGGFALDWYLRR